MARSTQLLVLIKNIYTLYSRKGFLLPVTYFSTESTIIFSLYFTLRVTGIKMYLLFISARQKARFTKRIILTISNRNRETFTNSITQAFPYDLLLYNKYTHFTFCD